MTGRLFLFAFIAFLVFEEGLSKECNEGMVKKKLRCNTRDEWNIVSNPPNPSTNIDFVIRAKESQECKGVWRPDLMDDNGAVSLEINYIGAAMFEARLLCLYIRGARKIVTRFELPGGAAPQEQTKEHTDVYCLKGLRTMTTKVTIKFFEQSPGSLEIYKFRMNACV